MKKKTSKDTIKRQLNDFKDVSPFEGIVLKEKKEPEKPKKKVAVPPKKPSEIVQGYNPNASFADILYSYEHSGNPYSMPKSSQKAIKSQKTDFGSILDKWEGKSTAKSVKSDTAKSSYKPTRSFGDILSQYEGVPAESPKPQKKEKEVAKEKTPYKREIKEYKATKGFGEILDSFENKDKKKNIAEKAEETVERKEPLNEEIEILSENLFKKSSEYKRDPAASWSVLGENESFVRPEKPLEKVEIKEEVKPVSKPYKPEKDFADILQEFDKSHEIKKSVIEAKREEVKEAESNPLFKESEDVRRSSRASWSVLGGNNSFKRDDAMNKDLPEIEPSAPKYVYSPTKDFSDILSEFKDDNVKTFEEILKEKGEESKKRVQTINELRMLRPQATLDLHQLTQDEAEKAIKEFLSECRENGIRKISIITGKGLHSEDGIGVLRSVTERVLDESGLVSEKKSAPLNAGGSGALWIILKA